MGYHRPLRESAAGGRDRKPARERKGGGGALPPPPPATAGGGGGLVGIASGVWAESPPGLPWGSRGGWGARGFGFNSNHGGEGEACTDLPSGCAAAAGDSATAAGRRWGRGQGRWGGEVVGTDGIIYRGAVSPSAGKRDPSFFFFSRNIGRAVLFWSPLLVLAFLKGHRNVWFQLILFFLLSKIKRIHSFLQYYQKFQKSSLSFLSFSSNPY